MPLSCETGVIFKIDVISREKPNAANLPLQRRLVENPAVTSGREERSSSPEAELQ